MGTKRDEIADGVRRRILSGQLERGSRLRQDQVAAWFSASITPVREAMQKLEADGLVVSEAHRGVRVAGIDFAWVKGLYQVRMLLEPYALRRAVLRVSRLEVRAAERLLAELRDAIAAGDAPARNRLTREFHFFFYDRCGSPGLAKEIAGHWDAFPWDLTLADSQRTKASDDEHEGLLAAVRAVEPKRAAELLEAHIGAGFAAVAAALGHAGEPDPFDVDND